MNLPANHFGDCLLGVGKGASRGWAEDAPPEPSRRSLDVDRVGEAGTGLADRLDQVTMGHAGAGKARLVGEETALLVLNYPEAQAQPATKDDPRQLRGCSTSQ